MLTNLRTLNIRRNMITELPTGKYKILNFPNKHNQSFLQLIFIFNPRYCFISSNASLFSNQEEN